MTSRIKYHAKTPLEMLAGQGFHRIADVVRTDGNEVRILRDAGENYPAWLDAIGKARRTIHLENYIFENDAVGRSFAEALVAAIRRGVTVRILYDWMGCLFRSTIDFWDGLRRAGIEVRAFNPLGLDSPLGWISRDHRKLLSVDGEIAFAGGLCIGHDWVGDPARGVAPWRDTAIAIRGPAVAHLEAAFADSWAAVGAPIPEGEISAIHESPTPGSFSVGVIATGPNGIGLYRLEHLIAELAQQTLWISDAYFVATTAYVRALRNAARDGVDVRLLVPGSSDSPVVRAFSRSGYRPLLEAGVRVFEWNGPMMHAKTAVADGCWARIGSSNSNLASWISNRELDITVENAEFAADMEAMFERDMEGATEIVLDFGKVRPTALQPRRRRRRGQRTGRTGRVIVGAAGIGSAVSAVLSQKRTLETAEGWVVGLAGIILLAIAAAILFLPGLIAYPLGTLGAWIAVTLLARAWKLGVLKRTEGKDGPKDKQR